MPGKIVISRTDSRDIGFREAVILLDGEQVAVLRAGKTAEIEVAAGKHTIRASNRMLKTPVLDIEVAEGETLSFNTANIATGCFTFLMILQMAAPKIILEPVIK